MKRLLLVVSTVSILMLLAVPIASAYVETPTEDAWVDGSNSFNPTTLQVQSSFSSDGCTPQYTTYLKWDLSGVANGSTVGTADLSLKVSNTAPNLGSTCTLALLQVDDDTWTEATLNSIRPVPGDTLSTINLNPASPPTVNSRISFPSTSALTTFLTNQVNGDDAASFALRITGCTAGVSNIRFWSSESTGNEPLLDLSDPNIVALSTFTTDTAAPTWPLYAGLGALALLAAAGVAWSRRRAALR